jgi:pyrroline-5-carboxylate reductase
MISAFICKNLLFFVLLKLAIAFSSETVTVSVPKMNIGFIGCGTIASSIATGLLRQSEHPISTIYVTRRSERKSSQLVEKFPDKVVICDDNQEICNKCELIFLCVLPEQVSSVLKSITFTEDKKLISLVSTSKVADLVHLSGLPSENCFKMICLPAVAELEGTPLIVPKSNSYVPTLMASLG